MELTYIGKGPFGDRYAFSGTIPFNAPDLAPLKRGDSIRDNGGKGMSMCVNTCCLCEKKYLYSTMILVAERGPCCPRSRT